MAYTPHTDQDIQEILRTIGVDSLEDLYRDVPDELLLDQPLDLPAHSEYETSEYFETRAAQNRIFPPGRSFLGAGAYRHFIPAALPYLASRGEFMTSYTPYQAEVSQGTLQSIFEFQSHIASLTGLEVANASMYDGATALAEALTMAVRDKRRDLVYLPELLNPGWMAVCETFLREIDVEIRLIPRKGGRTDFQAMEDEVEKAAAVVVCTPNAIGALEDGEAARALADKAQALLVAAVNPTSLGVVRAPGEYGADVAVGEAQPLGIPLSFGGPYAGFFATKRRLLRKMPGRLVGETTDEEGNRGYVLTLQTREQHIRRDKATSNICTNQGLFALMVTIYLSLLGKEGLREVAETSLARTTQLVRQLTEETGAANFDDNAPFFHETTVRLPIAAEEFLQRMKEDHGILAGFPVGRWFPQLPDAENLLLVNCTELTKPADIANYTKAAGEVLEKSSTPAGR